MFEISFSIKWTICLFFILTTSLRVTIILFEILCPNYSLTFFYCELGIFNIQNSEVGALEVILRRYPNEIFHFIKSHILYSLDNYISKYFSFVSTCFNRSPPGIINVRPDRDSMKRHKFLFYFVTNIETIFEKIFYWRFIFIKMALASSCVVILFVILGSSYLINFCFLEIGALEVFLSLYILLLYLIDFYGFPIKFTFIHGGTIKEDLVVDCENCIGNFLNISINTKAENDKNKWCQPCQTNYFIKNFKNWTGGDLQIDDYIQRKQLEKINDPVYTIFEWVRYLRFY